LILERIIESTRGDVSRRKQEVPICELPSRTRALRPGWFREALRGGPGLSVIAEVKRASPSAGIIRQDFDPGSIAEGYCRAGVAAISCLTEGPHFQGSLEHLVEVASVADRPVLQKDFIVDGYQLDEAVAFGADAVLLIVAAMDEGRLAELLRAAADRGLDALVEAHATDEAGVALGCGASVLGVNNRDLRTFTVDLATTELVAREVSREGLVLVSESGIRSSEDLRRLTDCGVDAVLVGEHFMRADDVRDAAARFVAEARAL
jgi:indole-3-glycerol phosphate synthase